MKIALPSPAAASVVLQCVWNNFPAQALCVAVTVPPLRAEHIENYIQGFGHPNIVLVLGRSKTQKYGESRLPICSAVLNARFLGILMRCILLTLFAVSCWLAVSSCTRR